MMDSKIFGISSVASKKGLSNGYLISPNINKHWVLRPISERVAELNVTKRKSEHYFWMEIKLYSSV